MMIVDSFFYCLFSWYFSKILYKRNGKKESCCFFLTKSYWVKTKAPKQVDSLNINLEFIYGDLTEKERNKFDTYGNEKQELVKIKVK